MSTSTTDLLISSFCLILGIFMMFIIANRYFSTRNIDEWLKTKGIITNSGIKHNRAVFTPFVEYQYSVEGIEYRGIYLTIWAKATTSQAVAQNWIAPYPIGKKVDVFYHPEKSHVAVLEKDISIKSILFAVAGSLFLTMIGLLLLIISLPY